MNRKGEYPVSKYTERFGSWDTALEKAGIDKQERLIDELQRVAKQVDGQPTWTQIRNISGYSVTSFSNEFGSWSDALEAAEVTETLESSSQQVKDDDRNGDMTSSSGSSQSKSSDDKKGAGSESDGILGNIMSEFDEQ